MNLPIRFPSDAERVRKAALAFRRLPPSERLRAIFDLIASGVALMEHSPRKTEARRLRAAQKEAWRKAMKEAIARHGK